MINREDLLNDVKVKAAYEKVFSGPEGELVLQHLCEQGYVMSPSYVRGDINEMLLNEGARRLVLSICKKAHFVPQQLPQQLEVPETTQQEEFKS